MGHATTAERLGLVATRCWVGIEHDSDDLVGEFRQRIENGWYSHVESKLEGARGVERRYAVDPDQPPSMRNTNFETLFSVRWKAERPGTTVECDVLWPQYAELRVTIVDDDGTPVPGASIFACGEGADADDNGQATMQVLAEQGPCLVQVTHYEDHTRLAGRAELAALAEHELRDVNIEISEADFSSLNEDLADLLAEDDGALEPHVVGYAEQAALFDELAEGATASEADLYTHLASHRRKMARFEDNRDERRSQIDDLLDRMREQTPVGEPLDSDAIREALDDIMKL